jgi:hypothetical protein
VEALHGGVVELEETRRSGDVQVLHEGRVLEPVTAPK